MIKAFAVALLATGLTGCLGIGASEFSCSAPKGVGCKSARTVYEDGRRGDRVQGASPDADYHLGYDPRDRWPNAPWVNAPTIDAPTPLRRPPVVMRAYIFPYEDSRGDLHMPGLIYTEIEDRRWNITDFALTSREDGGAGSVRPPVARSAPASTGR